MKMNRRHSNYLYRFLQWTCSAKCMTYASYTGIYNMSMWQSLLCSVHTAHTAAYLPYDHHGMLGMLSMTKVNKVFRLLSIQHHAVYDHKICMAFSLGNLQCFRTSWNHLCIFRCDLIRPMFAKSTKDSPTISYQRSFYKTVVSQFDPKMRNCPLCYL